MGTTDRPQEKQTVNIASIAQALGISKTTVSRAISGKGRVNEATRARVMEYIQQHNYRPNMLAKGLAQSKTYNIGLVIPIQFSSLDLSFIRKSLSAVYEIAAQSGYDVILSMTGDLETASVSRLLDNRKVDGMILTRSLESDPLIPLLKNSGIPFVVIGRMKDDDVLQVDNDQVGGCRELTELLLMKGMRRIALLGGSLLYTVNQSRLQGYCEAHADAGIPVDDRLLRLELESNEMRIHALDSVLNEHPDCILCMDEDVAVLVMRILKQRGLSVPQDVRVASLYDSESLLDIVPTVTAVQFDAAKLGRQAVYQLLKKMNGENVEPLMELGFQVVLRDSTKN